MATANPASKSSGAGNGSGARTSEAVDQIAGDIEKLRGELMALTDAVGKLGGEAAGNMRKHTNDLTSDVAAAYKAGVSDLTTELGRMEAKTARTIQANPLQAVGIAAGVGFLLAMMTRR